MQAAPHSPKTTFLNLQGLRGVLATLVCLGHFGAFEPVATRFGVRVNYGLSVDVFFALSGFVLCHTNFFAAKTIGAFLIDRFSRLYPLYILTFAAMCAIAPQGGGGLYSAGVGQEILLLHNLGFAPHGFPHDPPAWSVSIEFWVSLACFLGLANRRLRLAACLIVICVAIAAIGADFRNDVGDGLDFPLVIAARGFGGFAVGVSSFLMFERYRGVLVAPPLALYAALILLAGFLVLNPWSPLVSALFYASLAVALILLAANNRATFLASAPMMALGAISYSVYLLHFPIAALAGPWLSSLGLHGGVKLLALLGLVLASSVLVTRFFERPMQRFLRALAAGRRTERAAAPLAP